MAGFKIFVSYRREDSAAYAGRLYDRLATRFGVDSVFMDVDSIHPGQDFQDALDLMLRSCDAVLVVVGKGWLSATGGGRARRLDEPNDFVRAEIKTALQRGIPVVPILVGAASMPSAEDLPADLVPFARRQAIEIRDYHFHRDVDDLLESLGYDSSHLRSGRLDVPATGLSGVLVPASQIILSRVRSLIILTTGFCLALIVASPFWPALQPLWSIGLLLGWSVGYIGLRFRLTPAWILGAIVAPWTVAFFGAGWMPPGLADDFGPLLTILSASVWIGLSIMALRRLKTRPPAQGPPDPPGCAHLALAAVCDNV